MRYPWLIDAFLVGAAAVLIALQPPGERLELLRIGIFVAALVAAVRIIRRIVPRERPAPDLFDVEPMAPARQQIGALRSIELEVQMAAVHPYGVAWVTTLLRQLAAGRLMANRGIDMERQPEAARHVLGEPLWHVVGPEAARWPAAARRMAPTEIEACVAALERV